MREASVDFRKVTLVAYGKGGQSRKAEKEDNLGRGSRSQEADRIELSAVGGQGETCLVWGLWVVVLI